ncbi:flagellar biosynthesis protein FlgO [Pseudoalteromonas sp. C2R02]|uniref:FlgO family outer membrane protein n=1 Tax=Pseudoalteromonas sp. C2R02 TaxID=2841565 RepID=UPI001C07FC1F|nr:FlgO family outer membrane protein [Pseudoalteromonas sp. C2R02]MBU2969679.1 flagellar biosynthesis protein FlgO [Pseudoalteromonas sp. C2R02]
MNILKLIFLTFIFILLTACTSTSENRDNKCELDLVDSYCDEVEVEVNKDALVFKTKADYVINNTKLLSEYVEQMAMGLMDSFQAYAPDTKIAVTSFVDLNGNLQSTNMLGNQISESFIHEVQQYGIPVVDFKVMQYIEVNNRGDFVFSRNNQKLAESLEADYILSGTLVYTASGVVVNARIVNMSSKVIIASTKGLIPTFILESTLSPKLTSEDTNG